MVKAEWELAWRNLAVSEYALASGVTPAWIFECKSIVPARLDRPCNDPACGGWHFLPKNCYTQEDVDAGFVPAEILEWQ